ncbi:MAG TPA: IS200/IS605 family transposase [Candidatus Kapabacteria bacterium]|jgi:REP element-mobilizing transposase RayT|nr:IS200/IS605 family transposase [Candidatus Kapabacteria bacterium]
MANTYTQLYIHIVFAVKHRDRVIPGSKKADLHRYITGIVEHRECKLIAINSMPDHVHVLIGYNPKFALSDIVRDIKSASSKMMNEGGWVRGKFEWQDGFGAFSYSRSQLNVIIRYIENQEQHHTVKNFVEEYIEILEAFGIEYDRRYIFGWKKEE